MCPCRHRRRLFFFMPCDRRDFLPPGRRVCDRTSSPFRGDGCNASWEGKRASRDGAPRTSCETSLLNVSSRGGWMSGTWNSRCRALQILEGAAVCACARRVCGPEPRRPLTHRLPLFERSFKTSRQRAQTSTFFLTIQQICVRRSWRTFGCCRLTAATVRPLMELCFSK